MKSKKKNIIDSDVENKLVDSDIDNNINKEINNEELNETESDINNIFINNSKISTFIDYNTVEIGDLKKLVYIDLKQEFFMGRIIIKLEDTIVPKTVYNFIYFVKEKLYNDIIFHRIIKDFVIQGGDIVNKDGSGNISIYGKNFPDENFTLKNKKGCIAMANNGPNTNGCQFYILTNDAPWLDGKNVVFGNIVKGFDNIEYLENTEIDKNDKPIKDIIIDNIGFL